MSKPIVTRFAPSPTGFLHIGGARTALFNWLYAHANEGKMLLRIEDTDQKRSTDEATAVIYEGLRWLGLDWDGEAVSQISRAQRHRRIGEQLLAEDKAYHCYASVLQLQEMREKSRADGTPMRYEWRHRDPIDAPPDVKPVIRLKAPQSGRTIINDLVQGEVTFDNPNLDDMVLVRSNGTPTYMLAVVVDDHDMGVTHIIRGDDHLTNAARQILLYEALGWEIPVMAHISLIHGTDGAKLSKRHGALGVEAYRAMGYLPQALRNYLVRLGWSHGDDEIISLDQMLEWFDTDAIGKGASRFDFSKLEHLNGHYIRASNDKFLVTELLTNAKYFENGKHLDHQLSPEEINFLTKAMPLIKQKAKTLDELANSSRFLFSKRPLTPDGKAQKILDDNAKKILANLLPHLQKIATWEHDQISAKVYEFCEQSDIKLGRIAQPIRCAIAGTPAAPGVFEIMELLGREETLARIGDQAEGH